ncbi:hypothetical protein V8G54_011798 [Vigna mungo]|uniref:Polygalacturonase n=1 Tax=Vigna mungo TaxID=3915 RepID=A0AAQ3NS96_VIGMU
MKFSMILSFFCFITISFHLTQSTTLQISQFGGKPNGNIAQDFFVITTISSMICHFHILKALKSAWTQACASTSAVKIVIPKGNYQMTHVLLKGPCKAPIELYVDGIIKAPVKPQDVGGNEILRFDYVNALTMSGNGVFDGQGSYAWTQSDCSKTFNCKFLGMNLAFNFLNNSIIRGITSKDSKQFHINVLGCNNFTFDGFKVTAPHDSANTDGIHIGRSKVVNVLNTDIGTGDDCVSLGDGSKQVLVQNVKCGPGHGISVGSLGKYTNEEPVDGITIKDCSLKGTQNGVRIKTWPSEPGAITITNMRFEDLTMDNVSNPVIIDQEYCPWNQCTKKYPSKIKISKVTIKNIKGTSATKEGVILSCSSGVPCEGVEISNVDLKFNGSPTIAVCSNVKPKITGTAPTCTAPSTKKQ